MAAPRRLPHLGPPAAADHPANVFMSTPTGINSVHRGGDAMVKYRAASNRSKLPEPLRLFAYILETNIAELEWYDETYSIISAGGRDNRIPQAWYGSTDFIRTVNLITALDQLETEDPAVVEITDSKVLLHCLNTHAQLLHLHPNAELQHHPALAHWARTVLRWGDESPDTRPARPGVEIRRAVVRYVKRILVELAKSHTDAPTKVPKPSVFLTTAFEDDAETAFKVEDCVAVLDKQGIPWRIWYRDVLPEKALAIGRTQLEQAAETGTLDGAQSFEEWYAMNAQAEASPSQEGAPANASEDQDGIENPAQPEQQPGTGEPLTVDGITNLSRTDPDQAHQLLVNLPIDLPSMEIINAVLSSGQANLENSVVACNYIQHGLRKLESSSSEGSSGTNDSDEPYSPSLDPEERRRKVKLLVLFIRNLIRRGLVPIDLLQYDIQEICVRYAPIKEVRELKHWVQTGEEP